MPRIVGHKFGVEALRNIVKHCNNLGVEYLTLYAFSTENWNRPEDEVSGLMDLLVTYLRNEIKELNENQVRMNFIGYLEGMPKFARDEMDLAVLQTKDNKGLTLNLAINYGGRDEIRRGIIDIAKAVKDGTLNPEDISEDTISNHMYTSGQLDPDLIIRTSGEIRMSNFLLWQLAYSEFYFTDVLWPDFNEKELDKAIDEYNRRSRRYGKV